MKRTRIAMEAVIPCVRWWEDVSVVVDGLGRREATEAKATNAVRKASY